MSFESDRLHFLVKSLIDYKIGREELEELNLGQLHYQATIHYRE